MNHLKVFEEFNDKSKEIKVIVSKHYSKDQAEILINTLEDVHDISSQFIDWTDDGRVILELYPTNYDGTYDEFLFFVENSEYFDETL